MSLSPFCLSLFSFPRPLGCHDERGGGGSQRCNINSNNNTVSGNTPQGNNHRNQERLRRCCRFLLPPQALPIPPPMLRGKGGEGERNRRGRDYRGTEDWGGGGGVWRRWWRWWQQQWYQCLSSALPWAGTCGVLLPQADNLPSQLVHPHGLQPISFLYSEWWMWVCGLSPKVLVFYYPNDPHLITQCHYISRTCFHSEEDVFSFQSTQVLLFFISPFRFTTATDLSWILVAYHFLHKYNSYKWLFAGTKDGLKFEFTLFGEAALFLLTYMCVYFPSVCNTRHKLYWYLLHHFFKADLTHFAQRYNRMEWKSF